MKLKTLVCLSLITLVTSLVPAAHAQTYTHYRPGPDGVEPQAGVTVRGDFVFGTTTRGGTGAGEVFEVKHLGELTNFGGGDGPGPEAGLSPDLAINLEFTTVPEPAPLVLLGTGILGGAGVLRHKLF